MLIQMRNLAAPAFILASALCLFAIDQPTYDKIKAEEMEHSQIMRTLHMLTDRYGPRLTGSPNFENAARAADRAKTRQTQALPNLRKLRQGINFHNSLTFKDLTTTDSCTLLS